MTSITIPNSVTGIGNSAFQGCIGLTSITISESVTSIPTEAFKGCSSLTSIIIPESVTMIGSDAFYECSNLTSVTIPGSVTVIIKSFRGCPITDVYYTGTERQWQTTYKSSPLTEANIHYIVLANEINLSKSCLYLPLECNETLTVTISPDNTTDKTVIWTSSDPDIASVDTDGKITGLNEGMAVITAKTGNKTATCDVTVYSSIPITSISLNKTSLLVSPGENETLAATIISDSITYEPITWSSSDSSVATVDASGKVTAIEIGTAIITASVGGKSTTCTVMVDTIAVNDISLNKASLSLEVGRTSTLIASVSPDNATDKTVTWSSSDTSIATVDTNGKVTAVKLGTAIITAKSGNKNATCTVSVDRWKNPENVQFGTTYSVNWSGHDKTKDYYFHKFELSEQGVVTVEADKSTMGNIEFFIYDKDIELIYSNASNSTASYTTIKSCIKIGLGPGEYYLAIKPGAQVINWGMEISYQLFFYPNEFCETEPNNETTMADIMELDQTYLGYFGTDGTTVGHYIDYKYNADYWKIYLVEGTKYRYNIGNYSQIEDTTIVNEIYDPSNKKIYEVAKDENIRNDEDVHTYDFVAGSTGWYTVSIYNYDREQLEYYIGFTQLRIAVSEVTLSEDSIELKVGETKSLSATVLPANATNTKIKWSSEDPSVVSVDTNGKIIGIGTGSTYIMATTWGKSDFCYVTVVKADDVKDSNNEPEENNPDVKGNSDVNNNPDENNSDVNDNPNVNNNTDTQITTVTMLRLYNPNSGEHFYTSSEREKKALVKQGWNYEGIAWEGPSWSNTPVYRLYNENVGEHHYTTSKKERDNLVKAGWKDEGIGWYSDDAKTTPLYRLYNPNAVTGSHHYTTSARERDKLVKQGWKDEGIGWYGL